MKTNSKKNPVQPQQPVQKSKLRENIEAILVAIALALFIRTFIVQAFKIPSGSMKDTLLIGDHILVNKFIYGVKMPFIGTTLIPIKKPARGDIVVFKYPNDPSKDFIKRVVGVAGDAVEVRNKEVFVNGARIQDQAYAVHCEPHIFSPENCMGEAAFCCNRDQCRPITVPPDSLFVMGDNRDNSHDSRFWGFVNLKAVRGKAFLIYWSWDGDNHGPIWDYIRWGRIGQILK